MQTNETSPSNEKSVLSRRRFMIAGGAAAARGYEVEHVLDVPPEAFEPPPRVDSAVVRMTPKPAAPGVDAAVLGELVRVAFSQRRKLLRHTLGRWLEARGSSVSFDVQRRAEEVPVAEYLRLAASL